MLKLYFMCSYKTWYYEEKIGYVIECSRCDKIQVGFGNVLITFFKEEFSSFRKHIVQIFNRQQYVEESNIKHIMIPTPCTGLTLLLNAQELNELYTMLETADNEIQASQLLQLFKENN